MYLHYICNFTWLLLSHRTWWVVSWVKFLSLFVPTVCSRPPLHVDLSFFILPHLNPSFVRVIITTTTRGRHLTRHVNMSCNKPLSQGTHVVVFLMRAYIFHLKCFSSLTDSETISWWPKTQTTQTLVLQKENTWKNTQALLWTGLLYLYKG